MRIHFVVPSTFADLAAQLPDLRIDKDYPYWLGGPFNWAAQSWLVLRQFREGLTLGTNPDPGVINFGHSFMWRSIGARTGEYRVGVRADYRRTFDIDFEILQNPAVEFSSKQAYLPYWPIPGQIARRSTRRTVKTVAYAGRIGQRNLAAEIRTGAWRGKDLHGLDLIVVPPDKWHDMSDIDLLIAVRSFDRRSYPDKPPSKLFNAWRSDIPLVAGFDSAFSVVGRPGKDYSRVGSVEEFTQAILRLREEPSHYDSIVEEGRRRAAEVSHEALAFRWLDLFDKQIWPTYQRWFHEGGPKRRLIINHIADRARDLASTIKAQLSSRLMSQANNGASIGSSKLATCTGVEAADVELT